MLRNRTQHTALHTVLHETPALSDAELVSRVLSGDTEAFGPLVERYERAVQGLLGRLLGSASREAEDLAQETFIRAYQYLDGLEKRHRFGPWLFRIARSLCRDRLRRIEIEKRALQWRRELLRLESVPVRDSLESSLSRLPPQEHDVLKMRYYDGLTYDEIALRKGLTFGKVDHLIRRARARLARTLKTERQRERAL